MKVETAGAIAVRAIGIVQIVSGISAIISALAFAREMPSNWSWARGYLYPPAFYICLGIVAIVASRPLGKWISKGFKDEA